MYDMLYALVLKREVVLVSNSNSKYLVAGPKSSENMNE